MWWSIQRVAILNPLKFIKVSLRIYWFVPGGKLYTANLLDIFIIIKLIPKIKQ